MPISDKDSEFMKEVAEYFRNTRSKENPDGSIRETANQFGINRNKVRKILVTTGDITSPITEEAKALQAQGMSVETIAERLGVSTATVSTYLPYTDTIKSTLEPTEHTQAVREYRAHEKKRAELQVQRQMNGDGREQTMDKTWKDEWKNDIKMSYTETDTRPQRMTWTDAEQIRNRGIFDDIKDLIDEVITDTEQEKKEDTEEMENLKRINSLTEKQKQRLLELEEKYGLFPGALTSRQAEDLETISGERVPFAPREVRRLHLELENWLDDEDTEILKKHGNLKHGSTITRDVVVPYDIPLYALHYLIQRLFGWQNSHLHKFELPEDRLLKITENNASVWAKLVGIMFRSPYMSEEDEFWADDYEGGSFKNWLTKKYTGPYLSQCYGEGFISCQCDMEKIFNAMLNKQKYYVLYIKYPDEEELVVKMYPVNRPDGKKNPKPTWDSKEAETRVETVEFGNAPIKGLLFDRDPFTILERLPLDSVMSAKPCELTGSEQLDNLEKFIVRLLTTKIDEPDEQVFPQAFTDTLYYSYDYGDGWSVKITITDDCRDLVEQGRITQEQLDKAQIKCRELYRPVTLAIDGEMLMDDVGGLGGFVEFLQTINPDLTGMSKEKKEEAKEEKRAMLEWAKGQNWKKLNPMI